MFSSIKQTPHLQRSRQKIASSAKKEISYSESDDISTNTQNVVQTQIKKIPITPQYLTCNEKRVISLVGNIPTYIRDLFKKFSHDKNVTGELNYTSGYAYVIMGYDCYVWNYQKNSNDIRVFNLPTSKKYFVNFIPMSMTNTYNIGLMVCTYEGIIRYWSDISANPSNYISVDLELNNNNCTCMEKNETNSFLIGTSNCHLYLVNIINLRGTPELICSQVANSVSLFRKVGSFLFSDINNKKVIKILPQPEINNLRDVYIVTSQSIQLWEFKNNNQERIIFDKPVLNMLNELFIPPKDQSEIKEKYNPEVKIIDCDITRENQILFLISYKLNDEVQRYHLKNEDYMEEDFTSNYSFALVFCDIEQDNIQVSNVKLIEKSVDDKNYGAKLVLPNRGPVICILFENTIVLTTTGKDVAYKEIFSINEKILGYGIDRSKIWNPEADTQESIHILCRNKKIFDIEISIENIYYENHSEYIDSKKHALYSFLEQVVFFDNDENPIYFELPNCSISDLEIVAKQLSDNILNSKSEFLPPVIDLKSYLYEKLLRLQKIIDFLKEKNKLNEISLSSKLGLFWNAEKEAAAIELWRYANSKIGKSDNNNKPYLNILAQIITAFYRNKNISPERDDIIRSFFYNYVADLPYLLKFIPISQSEDEQIEINEIILTILEAAYNYRKQNGLDYGLNQDSISGVEPWTASEAILNIFQTNFENTEAYLNNNKIYPDIENMNDTNIKSNVEKRKIMEDQLVKLASLTLKIFNERIAFIKKTEMVAVLKSLQDEYLEKRSSFIKPLAQINRIQTAIELAEEYHDFETLVELSIDDEEKQHYYIDQYCNEYADILFDKLQLRNNYCKLLEQDDKYNVILKNYFDKKNIPLISWIHDIKLKNYDSAYRKLIKSKGIMKQTQRKQQLSIAKLSLIAAKKRKMMKLKKMNEDDIKLADTELAYYNKLQKTAFQLKFVDILKAYKEKLINGFKDNPEYENLSEEEKQKPENIINIYYQDEGFQYKNEYKSFYDLQKKYSKEILSENMIQIDEFIDFLTFEGLLLTGDNSIENFLYAIQFYRYLEDEIPEDDRECVLQGLWRRAVLNTNWDKLKMDINDEQINEMLENTALFKLILYLKSEKLFKLIRKPQDCYEIPNVDKKYPWASEDEKLSISEEYKKEIQQLGFYITHFNISDIIEQIINSS
ncbi:hypothetical protein BCR32DRAFT_290138 [Anaeromyces robustus]|uniref:Nucleoporin Nup133/Nup155-like N-terminal domain-containing protein n=1 Tax=Anaeromyces robustus TaxID=1754192 RepID=A0A1Y1XKJ4_9FUNG|nr:hypothetical protein BCR32DRAFT_290138 [Anaeromyces robustus]|eukprot:ORX86289.1 hypothetical protein BCR32DRAFT_290138 [Anaeromyces robustus]